jgi:hypothetical protein
VVTAVVYAMAFNLGLTVPEGVGWTPVIWSMATFAITAFVLFRLLFEKVLWRHKPFSLMMTVPDLSGQWQGELESYTFGTRHWSLVTIKQDFDRIFYSSQRMEDGKPIAHERTLACTIRRNADSNWVELVVVYGNTAGAERDTFGFSHEGTALFYLVNEDAGAASWLLDGHYWTNKKYPVPAGRAATQGKITLERLASENEWQANQALREEALARTTKSNVRKVHNS